MTLGKDGSCAYYKGKSSCKTISQDTTIETTGAGDTFTGCMLNFVLEKGLDDLTESDLAEMLIFANAGASLITTRRGALKVMPEKKKSKKLYRDVVVRKNYNVPNSLTFFELSLPDNVYEENLKS